MDHIKCHVLQPIFPCKKKRSALTVVAKIIRKPDRSGKYLPFFASKTLFNFIMIIQTCRWLLWAQQISDEVSRTVFNSLLTLIFGVSTFCNNYSSTSLWHSVNIFPENFKTNVIPCLIKPNKAFLWMYNRSVQFIFQLAPNLLNVFEVWTLRGQSIIFNVPADSFLRR